MSLRTAMKYGNLQVEEVEIKKWEETRKGLIIKLPRPIKVTLSSTGAIVELENLSMAAVQGYSKPIIFVGDGSENEKYIIHYNLIDDWDCIRTTDGRKIYGQQFCNDIDCSMILSNPVLATAEIVLNLENPNPSSAYGYPTERLQKSVSYWDYDHIIQCQYCHNPMLKDIAPLNLISQTCPSCMEEHVDSLVDLESTGFYLKKKGNSSYTHYKSRNNTNISEYYPIFRASEIVGALDNIQKAQQDIICLGLGSAGSGILEQLGRTSFVNNIVLVDFDTIERKNLRNQWYINSFLGKTKAYGSHHILKQMGKESIKIYIRKFQDVNFRFMKTKYIVLGFDTIKTRLEAFRDVMSGKIESQYLIDARYDDLTASVYFVDLSKEDEVKYYEQLLMIDYERFNALNPESTEPEFTPITEEEFKNLFERRHLFTSDCSEYTELIFGKHFMHNFCNTDLCTLRIQDCSSRNCVAHWVKAINDRQINVYKILENEEGIPVKPEDNSCLRTDLISIYKYASSYVTSNIREIEQGRSKVFTHVDVTCDGLPSAMVMKK